MRGTEEIVSAAVIAWIIVAVVVCDEIVEMQHMRLSSPADMQMEDNLLKRWSDELVDFPRSSGYYVDLIFGGIYVK